MYLQGMGILSTFDYTNTFAPITSEITAGVSAVIVATAVLFGVILSLKFGFGWLKRVVGR
jgi:hypothetical protein